MELGATVPEPEGYRRKRLVKGLVVFACALGVAAVYLSSQRPTIRLVMKHIDEIPNGREIKAELRKAHARFHAKRYSNVSAVPKASELADYESFNVDCYSYTGGTCRIQDCDFQRKAECVHHWGAGFFCMCPEGTCTGADGTCYPGNYKKIAEGIEIKNALFQGETMYFPRNMMLSGVGVDSDADGKKYDDKFDIYLLPGLVHAGEGSVDTKFVEAFVTTTEQPDYVAVAIQEDAFFNTVQTLKLNRYVLNPNDIQTSSTIICVTDRGNYQLGSYAGWLSKAVHWWYISKLEFSGSVYEWVLGPPGPGGEWYFTPDLSQADQAVIRACA